MTYKQNILKLQNKNTFLRRLMKNVKIKSKKKYKLAPQKWAHQQVKQNRKREVDSKSLDKKTAIFS